MDIGSLLPAAQSLPADALTLLQGVLPESTLTGVTAGIAVCAAVATCLPAPKPASGKVYRTVYAVVNWVACNLGKAKNAQDAPKATNKWKL
jgi:hypothetical protein